MELMNKTSYEVVTDKLIIDFNHPLDIKTVQLNSNQGTVKRGTLLSLVEPTHTYVKFGAALAEGQTSKANCIVADEIDTTTADLKVTAVAYSSGNFNSNELIITVGSTLDITSIEELRNAGIYLSSSN